ncbi:MAG: hypothetical protein E2O78_00970 [Caldithrix sp.]|nr:MAG: hypothetical protein E2O78_00970 [Caldithrix sp.]
MKSANHLLQKLCVLAALPLFVNACVSPKAVYRLQPVDENTVWLFGSEYVIQGKVFFPITKQARYLELALPIGDFEVTVLFKQHRHKV